jgi:copper chaperone CopZ
MKMKSLTLASIGAAIVASLCCIGPLFAVIVGIGSFGAAAFFEQLRPYLLTLTGLLLASAFYLTYRSKASVACVEDTCQRGFSMRHQKLLLWIAAGLAGLFAAFPYYSGAVWKALPRTPVDAAQAASTVLAAPTPAAASTVTLHVEGMFCAGCAALVESSLSRVEGIRRVSVSLENNTAIVEYDPSRVSSERMIQTVSDAGYKAGL